MKLQPVIKMDYFCGIQSLDILIDGQMALCLINESVLVIRYAYFKLPVLEAICPSYILISNNVY
jgi:hypothetical protein